MQSPKVSIITVCLNSAITIEQTIQSVVGQSYNNIEYIIIDGGSTDGTLDIIKKYEAHIAYWVSEPDNGIYDAMNKGTAHATGELIAFMNSDDWYAAGAVELAAKNFVKTGADVLYGEVVIIDGTTELFMSPQKVNLDRLCYYGMIAPHQGIFVRTSLQKKYMFDLSYRITADFKFLLTLYMEGKHFQYIKGKIAFYRLGGYSSNGYLFYKEMKSILTSNLLLYPEISKKYYEKVHDRINELGMACTTRYLSRRICAAKQKGWVNRNISNEKQYILFGAGDMGQLWLEVMNVLGLKILEIWSNDVKQEGTLLEGKIIRFPKKELNSDYCILISSCRFESDISSQLKTMGYKENADFWGYRECLKWASGVMLKRKAKNKEFANYTG